MFGSKLRSWMEAVRSRKKQHRKEKQSKCNLENSGKLFGKLDPDLKVLREEYKETDKKVRTGCRLANQCRPGTSEITGNHDHSRYSANNLSSPESAYSTGYSTDGNSPGAPPEGILNNSKHSGACSSDSTLHTFPSPKLKSISLQSNLLAPNNVNVSSNHPKLTPILKIREIEEPRIVPQNSTIIENVLAPASPLTGMMSPRQRNRIRTNPWVPNSTLSPVKQTTVPSKVNIESPRFNRIHSPSVSRRKSLSSSSCSSLSATSVQLDVPRPLSISDEDFTLNEMMGKYDESYIYEKETDILSDSDPTDCETDMDTGRDGGDEDDTFEGDLDFIDNGSHTEFDIKIDHNTGHCSYFNYELQKKRSSRKRTTRRSKRCSVERGERKRRSCSNKRRLLQKSFEREKNSIAYVDGSKSAGATPLSVRRANSRPVSKLALQDSFRKRSNSIGFYHDNISTIDKRDKEADMKYRELITEADQLLRTMKINGLSPRRVPGPANKRVELLRTTECANPEIFAKNKVQLLEDNITKSFSKIPSSAMPSCPRFSPKKNHITKFIISNSPIMVKKEWEMQNNMYVSPISQRKSIENVSPKENVLPREKVSFNKEKSFTGVKSSPRFRRKYNRAHIGNSSSDSDDESIQKRLDKGKLCPLSEPVRRKVYFGQNNTQKSNNQQKSVAFDMERNTVESFKTDENFNNSTENLRQQVLMNTLVNLKRNLEDHSASLKQVYRSSHNLYV